MTRLLIAAAPNAWRRSAPSNQLIFVTSESKLFAASTTRSYRVEYACRAASWLCRPGGGSCWRRPDERREGRHNQRASTPRPFAAGLATWALTGPLLTGTAHRRSSGPSLTAGCVVLRLNRNYGRLRRPPGQRSTSRVTGYRTPRSGSTIRRLPGRRASPVPAATIDTFRPPYAGESLTAALPGSSPLPWPSP